jgi:cation-transporting ATPase E
VEPGLTTTPLGLSSAEVAERVAAGQVNRAPEAAGRSTGEILARNTFTWINLIFAILGGLSLATGAGPDATFLIIAVINTAVGTVQEIRAKRTLDNLAVINAPRVRVVRDGSVVEVAQEQVVLGDLIELGPGDQVVADAVVASGRAEVDESLATGESDPVDKSLGDPLLSGIWVVSGSMRASVTAVGGESYAGRLAVGARRFSLTTSELMTGINTILRWLALAMVIIGPILVIRQLQVLPWRLAVRSAVAALVGMIPEGLVLLTTLAFLSAAVRLGTRHVLVQELPAVEGLARVDALCTDKTGTLTEGRVEWDDLFLPGGERAGPERGVEYRAALAALASVPGANATIAAIAEGVGGDPGWVRLAEVPFSSARKWSAASFEGHGTWVLGAPELVVAADPDGLAARVHELAATGGRVLVLAHSNQLLTADQSLPAGLVLVAVVYLRERLRPDAASTLDYLARQQITVRVVSGDSATTVGAVASQVGLAGADRPIDAHDLPGEGPALDDLIENHTVFGRVTPDQKETIVDALRRRGHVIAMTGDGVNDTLALKDADLGIAMGAGSPVARSVAQLVLLDNEFSALPPVVSEGRRVLHNIERVASLFLVKNAYSIVISVVVAIAGWPYPFLPRQLTLISGLAIGIPGFFLALARSEERFRPGFVRRVSEFSAVAGSIASVAVLLSYAIARQEDSTPDQARTAAVIAAIVVSLWVLILAARPLRAWKVGMVLAIAGAFALSFVIPGVNTFFGVSHHPSVEVIVQSCLFGVGACAGISLATAALGRRRSGYSLSD